MTHDGSHATLQHQAETLIADFLSSTAAAIHKRLGDVAGVAVSTAKGALPLTLGASTALASEVDEIQYEVGTGPCLEALRVGTIQEAPDLAADDRWGSYGPRAAARGAASCVSVPIFVNDQAVAVFKVYSAQAGGLEQADRQLAELVAHEIGGGFALAMHISGQAADLDDMTALLTHRRVIDLALGILMERAQVSADSAFGLLRSQSQQRNVKVREVAQELVGSIPGAGPADLVPHFDPRG